MLVLDAYCKFAEAGYQQRDGKSGNLWIYHRPGEMPSVRVIDSDACAKTGHMSDARYEGLSSEEYTARALREKKYDQLGGTSQNTCTTYTANLDLLSKQCVPGEQAVVFSVTELLLRMMGESDICYTLQDIPPGRTLWAQRCCAPSRKRTTRRRT